MIPAHSDILRELGWQVGQGPGLGLWVISPAIAKGKDRSIDPEDTSRDLKWSDVIIYSGSERVQA